MNLDNAEQQARNVSGPKSAAKLYNSINHELELGGGGSEDSYEAGERALDILEQRFPGVARQASEITTPPQLSRKAKSNLDEPHEGRRRSRPALGAVDPRRHRRESRGPGRTLKQRASSATAIHARPRKSSLPGGGPRFAQTGIPGAYESTAQMVMRSIGAIAGIALLYVLVTPKGVAAVNLGSKGLTTGLQAIVSPSTDPLRPSTLPSKQAPPIGPRLASAVQAPVNQLAQQLLAPIGATHPNAATKHTR